MNKLNKSCLVEDSWRFSESNLTSLSADVFLKKREKKSPIKIPVHFSQFLLAYLDSWAPS